MAQDQYETLMNTLHDCVEACNQCYDACLKEDDVNMMAQCIRLDRECADFCSHVEQALLRDTPFAVELAGVCVQICVACGNECEKHDHDHCQRCADACKKCAEECRQLIS